MYVLAFRLALSQLMHRPISRLVVVVSMACILLMNGMVFLLFESFSKSLNEVRASKYITVYLDSSVPTKREESVLSAVRKISGVQHAQLVSKDAFIENFSKYFPQLSTELASLDADTIPRYVKVKTDDERVEARLAKLSGVEMVERNENKYAGLIGALGTLRNFALVLIAGMSVALLCILVNHFKLRTPFQTQVRRTLVLLGARGGQVLVPFAIEGFVEGLLGGALAAGALLAYGRVFESQLNGMFTAIGYHPFHFELGSLAVLIAVAGTLSGMLGSLWATMRVRS